jgi:hypothetical protein
MTKLQKQNRVWTNFWNLKFGASLELGAWDFEFSA